MITARLDCCFSVTDSAGLTGNVQIGSTKAFFGACPSYEQRHHFTLLFTYLVKRLYEARNVVT